MTQSNLTSNPWLAEHSSKARQGIGQVGLHAWREFYFSLPDNVSKSLDIGGALQHAGEQADWPLGYSRLSVRHDDFWYETPNPLPYGYWAANHAGDFYALQSLDEDENLATRDNTFYFDACIIKVAQSVLFASCFYRQAGVPEDCGISIAVSYKGLRGRTKSYRDPALWRPSTVKSSEADPGQQTIIATHSGLQDSNLHYVFSLCDPVFKSFNPDQTERPAHGAYAQIMSKYLSLLQSLFPVPQGGRLYAQLGTKEPVNFI